MPPSKRGSQREASVPQELPVGPYTGGSQHKERGTIISVDANRHVYRVATNSGRDLRVGRIKSHPGDMTLLPLQTPVRIDWSMGIPYIDGILPPEVQEDDDKVPHSVTDVDGHGGNDPVLSQGMGINSRAPDEPRDLMPGDAALLSPDGASVAALQGKIAQLRAGPLAKVQAFGEDDLVSITAGLLKIQTWMGEASVVNNDGKTSYIWRGGTDQLTQTGPDEERWTIRLDVGYTGDVVKFEVCDRTGRALFRFHVDSTGACELFAAGGLNQHSGSEQGQTHPQRFHGTRMLEVAGRDEVRVTDAVAHVYESSRSYEVGGDSADVVSGSYTLDVGGNRQDTITGNSDARVNGSATWTVRGATQFNVSGAYGVKTTGGTIRLDPGAGQTVIATGGALDGIKLGSNARSHAVKYEELSLAISALTQKLDGVMRLIATHTHPVAGPTATASLILATIAAALPANLSAAKSSQVLLE